MGSLHYPFRADWSDSGFFGFMKTRVKHASDGLEMLRQYIPFDQGDWAKSDVTGTSTYSKQYESSTSRLYEQLNADTLIAGAGVYKLRRRMRMPRDFGRSAASPLNGAADTFVGLFPTGVLTLFTYATGALTALKLTLEKAGVNDSTIAGSSVAPGLANTWQQFTFTPGSTYNPGDLMTWTLEYDSSTLGVQVRLADMTLAYLTARGNV